MQFVKPLPFEEATEKLGGKSVIGALLTSAQWAEVPVALRERAFFSSTVESYRFLERARGAINDFLEGAREVLPSGETALKVGSRADFVKQLQKFALSEGMGPLDPKDAGTIKDIRSQKRLELIFDTQTRQAQDFGAWKQGQDPDVLAEFPAQRFIRVDDVQHPRDRHAAFEGEVRLESDLEFWLAINQDFGVPWGPWGWGCGHDVEDVDWQEAEDLGLLKPGEKPKPVDHLFNAELKASTRGLGADMIEHLERNFGDQVEVKDGAVRWKGGAR